MNNSIPKVAFICIHNSCRTQIAEALGRYFAGDIFECFSAGTEVKSQINEDAVRLIKENYAIDMEKMRTQSYLHKFLPLKLLLRCGVMWNAHIFHVWKEYTGE